MEQRTYRQNKTEITGATIPNMMRPSPAIWSRFPVATIRKRPELGYYRYEDFRNFPPPPTVDAGTTKMGVATTTTLGTSLGNYKVFSNAGSLLRRVSAVNSVELLGGTLAMSTDTDNDVVLMADAYPSFRMSGLPGTDGKLCFELCLAQKSVVTNMASSFFGLAETELIDFSATVPLNAGDPISNVFSGIGFRIAEDGLGVIDTVSTDRATSFTNIGAAEGGTLVAFTFRKLGFVYDPKETDNCVTFFANNLELTTRVTRTALRAFTNLDANALGVLFGTVADSAGTAHELYIPWYAVGQMNPGVQP